MDRHIQLCAVTSLSMELVEELAVHLWSRERGETVALKSYSN